MKFMGSKNRHAKDLLPIILNDRYEGQWYVEPFVGGFNMIDKVDGNRIANDVHFYLIELFKAIQNGWEPPKVVTDEEYIKIRDNKGEYPPQLVGFVGFGCSYSGKWFGGYARGSNDKGEERNYTDESRRNILKQAPKIQGVVMENKNYWELYFPPKSIIYCDPPYEGATQYKEQFDHDLFWEWIRNISNMGHSVFVSEYNAPDDFECLFSKTVNNTLVQQTGSKQGIEKLFKFNQTLAPKTGAGERQ